MNVRKATITAALVLGAAAFGIAGCDSASLPVIPSGFTVSGVLTLHQSTSTYSTNAYTTLKYPLEHTCDGQGGFSDIRPGASVTVYDASGTIVGSGAITDDGSTSSTGCQFPFTVPNVPTGSAFYQYEISHRGKLTFTADEASSLAADLNN